MYNCLLSYYCNLIFPSITLFTGDWSVFGYLWKLDRPLPIHHWKTESANENFTGICNLVLGGKES